MPCPQCACSAKFCMLANTQILHQHVHVLLHVTQFCIKRQARYPPYGPWPHVPESVWAQQDAPEDDEEKLMTVFVVNYVLTVMKIYWGVAHVI